MGTDVTVRLMLGSTVVGIAAGIISYFLGVWLIRRIRQRKSDKSEFAQALSYSFLVVFMAKGSIEF